jgi:hypothetical protein
VLLAWSSASAQVCENLVRHHFTPKNRINLPKLVGILAPNLVKPTYPGDWYENPIAFCNSDKAVE